LANIITGIRIICGLLILACPAFSGSFYVFYILGGITDAIDGTVARKLGQVSDFGSKFDTAADFVFAIPVIIKILTSMNVPLWLMIWTGIIALIKTGSHIAGYIKYHELKTVHSVLNKICGGFIYLIPLFLGGGLAWQAKALLITAACVFATVAAIAECREILGNNKL